MNGFAVATGAARLPAIRDELALTPGELGLTLLWLSVGSVAMLTVAGAIVRLLGPARTVSAAAVVSMTGMAVVGFAGERWLLAIGLLLIGAGIGSWDVAMNVEGAAVERLLARVVMPRFHAAFSLGTVAGAGVGALAALGDVSVAVHLPAVALTTLVGALVAVRWFLPVLPEPARPADVPRERGAALRSQLRAWGESKTLLIGVLVFSMALAEGSANDWLALSVVDGYGASNAVGAAGLGVFVTGMTAARILGPNVLERRDPATVLRASAFFVLAGSGLLILGAVLADGDASPALFLLAAAGALLWGCGAALGFPMGMTAAAVDEKHAAARVGVVSTIGYTAFIAGPPLLGALGQHIGVAQSLVAVSAAVLLALFTAGAVKGYLPDEAREAV